MEMHCLFSTKMYPKLYLMNRLIKLHGEYYIYQEMTFDFYFKSSIQNSQDKSRVLFMGVKDTK
jgi:hypothetical protein